MHIYLPIAEMPVDIFVILFLGGITGILSGMFGVGGGFLTTPLLIFIGIPPAVAVSSSANQIIGASFSGFLAHFRKSNIDFKMGTLLLIGGMVGSTIGVAIFALLKAIGQIDLVISLTYVFFLGTIGTLMTLDSAKAVFLHKKNKSVQKQQKKISDFFHNLKLPYVTEFPKSKLTISAILPITIGFLVGIVVSIMGIGGGLIMIPAMIYILGIPTTIVIGTSLFQIIFITANVTLLQAINTHTVDIVLAILLLASSVIGAQFGTKISTKLASEQVRGLLAILVLGVALKLAFGLFITPNNLYEIQQIEVQP